jgi:hypothetical protein
MPHRESLAVRWSECASTAHTASNYVAKRCSHPLRQPHHKQAAAPLDQLNNTGQPAALQRRPTWQRSQPRAADPMSAATEQILVHGIRRRESGTHC